MKRKIAAILAADIVGYSRLVGEDEEETLRRLASYRAVFGDFIARFGGRIFNTAGDAILAEFASAVDAVRCAVDTQESLRTRNQAYPPSRQMNFRIGITIGDIIEREGDLLGEGVNIASRLEGIAPPGGICVSRSVHEAVANKISLKFVDVGEQQLKNLPDPVHAYTVTLDKPVSRQKLLHSKAVAKPIWLGAATIIVGGLVWGAYVHGARNQDPAREPRSVTSTIPTKPPETAIRLATTPPQEGAAVPKEPVAQAKDAASENKETISGQLAGDWKGPATEIGGGTYNVEISGLKDGKGTIRYPDLKCSGTLEYMLRRGETNVFREKITKGTVCGRTAEVELKVASADGSLIDYNWIGQGLKLAGRLSGEMSATEDCLKYLPNRGVMIPAQCNSTDNASEAKPSVSTSSVDIDPATLGVWILTVPRGHWILVIRDDGTYDFHSEASDGASPHSGRFDARDGRWSLQATNGYTDGGTYEVLPSGAFIATGRLGTGAWQPADPVRRTH
jgi:class 3 adenylate cyclase